MNCRPGDVAVIVRDEAPGNVNLGRLVLVIGIDGKCDPNEWLIEPLSRLLAENLDGSFSWVSAGAVEIYQFDSSLRPLRDNPGEDEILRIAGKPQTITEDQHERI